MFRLDALVLLRASEAKAWGTSICSYVEAWWRASLLIDHGGGGGWVSLLP